MTARSGNPLPGTRPAGAGNEAEAARQVREMFSRIAPRYDFLNHLLSVRWDMKWRRRVARHFGHILSRDGAFVLDLCCGTGDLTLALGVAARACVLGCDFAHPMLVRARQKSLAVQGGGPDPLGRGHRATSAGETAQVRAPIFLEGDALQLPFADARFDLATLAFGFRNLANYERGLREIRRILRPGGEIAILEFAEPNGPLLGPLYRFYFRSILPRLGGAVSGNAAAYSYLPNSVAKFPLPENLSTLMANVGFADVRFERWSGGIVVLHTARRA